MNTTNTISYIIGGDSLTVFFKGNSYTINRQSHTYDLVLKAITNNDTGALETALNIRQGIVNALQKRASGKVSIEGSQIFYGDREVTGLIVSRIFDVIRQGLDVSPMVNFLENLMKNPSKRAVDELFGFLDACKLPITADGCFLAYKRVRANYMDVHSGTMDNSVGKVLEMERNLVDEDKNNTCSYGLHFCSYDYLKHFSGDRIMVLKINPADVVAIPADYNNSKGRTCRYEVVDEIPVDEYRMPVNTIREGYENAYDCDYCEEADDFDEEAWDALLDDEIDEINKISDKNEVQLNPSAKVTPDIVREIRRKVNRPGWTSANIAAYYNISPRQVRRIISREAWAWVED